MVSDSSSLFVQLQHHPSSSSQSKVTAAPMLQTGVIPIMVESQVSEWIHDCGNPKSRELVKEVNSR